MIVQIYGFTSPADLRAVDGIGVDHVGIVLDEGFDTWDAADHDTVRRMRAAVPPSAKVVALSSRTDPDGIRATAQVVEPHIVHLVHAGDMRGRAFEELRRGIGPVDIMATVPVRDAGALDLARELSRHCDYLLLDTVDPATGVVGATGQVHDWAISRGIVEAVDVPVILAGGLGPENVVDAVRAVGPWGVDSETRTSRSDDRRRKDLRKVRHFVEAARAAAPGVDRPRP
jgi:phosphoribosylanthranilate isomerase